MSGRVLFLSSLLLFLVIVAFFRFRPPPSSSIPNWQSVPEMTDILGPDQTTRLNAGRRLVERVGVEQALEILEHSPMPHTGEGHLVVHQIGFYAFQKYGLDGILKCKDYFLYACYHGVIIEAATAQGVEAIAQMVQKCETSSLRHFQCAHATGHALLALLGYSHLPESLQTCDQIFAPKTNFPEALSSCHNGAFMENLFGVHEWGTNQANSRQWLKDDDPYFPCNAFGQVYQRGCWLNQAARIYQMYQGDIPQTAAACQGIGNDQYVAWCFDNLARQIHPITNGDIHQVFPLCRQLPGDWYDNCVIVNAGAYYSVGGRDQAIGVCQNFTSPAQSQCFHRLLGQILGDDLAPSQKASYCPKLPPPFNQQCLSQLQSPN